VRSEDENGDAIMEEGVSSYCLICIGFFVNVPNLQNCRTDQTHCYLADLQYPTYQLLGCLRMPRTSTQNPSGWSG
jgi:hypothetical protein